MSITVTPTHARLRRRDFRHRPCPAAEARRPRRHRGRDQPLCDRGLSRPDADRRPADRLRRAISARSIPRRRRRGTPASSIASPRATSPTSPISTATARCSTANASAGSTGWPIACGTPTPRSAPCRARSRCSMPMSCPTKAATPSSPTCARPTMRCRTAPGRSSKGWSPSIRSGIRAASSPSPPVHAGGAAPACRRCRSAWCARIPARHRKTLYVAAHASHIDRHAGRRRPPAADGPDRARHAAPLRACPHLEARATW